jgi:hypothetical protein
MDSERVHGKKIVGPQNRSEFIRCIYCLRKDCEDCPLPFADKTNLKNFLKSKQAPLLASYHFKDDDDFNQQKK